MAARASSSSLAALRVRVAALSRLVTDANLRRTYGDNAAALVADRFDAEDTRRGSSMSWLTS